MKLRPQATFRRKAHGAGRACLDLVAAAAVAVLLPACGTAAPHEPTSAPPPAGTHSAATPPPATPTTVPTALPPIPTANFTPDQIFATWYRFDFDRGALYISLFANGVYDAAHGTIEGSVHHGRYSLEGTLFTFLDGWNCSPEPHTPGEYVLRLIGGGRFLYFDPYQDTCPDRPLSLNGFRWERWVPTSTPAP